MTTEIPVAVLSVESPPTIIKLADGTVISVQLFVTQAVRIAGMWDAKGNPVYNYGLGQRVEILKAPEELRGTPNIQIAPSPEKAADMVLGRKPQ